eukprot:354575-Chlamydomonas_euryale.AAC.12
MFFSLGLVLKRFRSPSCSPRGCCLSADHIPFQAWSARGPHPFPGLVCPPTTSLHRPGLPADHIPFQAWSASRPHP